MSDFNIPYEPPRFTLNEVSSEPNLSPATIPFTLLNTPPPLRHFFHTTTPLANTAVSRIALITKAGREEIALTYCFYAPILAGIEAACREHNLNLFFANLPADENNHHNRLPRLLTEQSVDGLLFMGTSLDPDSAAIFQRQNAPVVLVDAAGPTIHFDAVVSDDKAGGYEATQYLIQKGHHRIAMVSSLPQTLPSIQKRQAGYLQALEEHQLPPYLLDAQHHPEVAVTIIRKFLAEHPEITAVVGATDAAALGVMLAAKTSGKRLPQDLSLISCDNIRLAQQLTPPLTTMHIHKTEIGRSALQLLLHRINHPKKKPMRLVIRPSLVERQSVAEFVGK